MSNHANVRDVASEIAEEILDSDIEGDFDVGILDILVENTDKLSREVAREIQFILSADPDFESEIISEVLTDITDGNLPEEAIADALESTGAVVSLEKDDKNLAQEILDRHDVSA